jgi:guanylate kinase
VSKSKISNEEAGLKSSKSSNASNASKSPGCLFIVVAPSGAGKTSLVKALLAQRPGVELSVSFTTRQPRPGEQQGLDYFFISTETFLAMRAAGDFLESAEVHGNFYATSRTWIESRISVGADILLEIDCQGAQQVSRLFPDAVGVFIAPPSIAELRERLLKRGQDSADVIERRLTAARGELLQAGEFEYVIINQDFATALGQMLAIVDVARLRFAKQRARYSSLFESWGLG